MIGRRCPELRADLTGRAFVITGGNSGIGLAAATALARHSARVVITARSREKGERAVASIAAETGSDRVEWVELDLANLASVRRCATALLSRCPAIDALVLNAGVYLSEEQVTEDGFEATFQTNHLGHFLLTHLLLPRLRESAPARVVVVASAAHRSAKTWEPPHRYRAMEAYANSKLANLLFARELARRTAGDGIVVNAVHPGTVRSGWGMDGDATGLLRIGLLIARPVFRSPERGADTIVHLAASPRSADETGGYWVDCQRRPPARRGRDDRLARDLWERSEQLLGLARTSDVR